MVLVNIVVIIIMIIVIRSINHSNHDIVIIVIIMIIVTNKIIIMILKKSTIRQIGIIGYDNNKSQLKVETLIHNHPHQSNQSLPSIHLYLQDLQFHRVQNLPDLE